jgi:inhibitor of the pro-sigma K processing machinery
MGALALFGGISEAIGVHLGVNLFNGLVLGLLGAPGFGLLLMLHWILQR